MEYDKIKLFFNNRGFILTTKENEYKSISTTKFWYICPNGHTHHVRWFEFIKDDYECNICKRLKIKTDYNVIIDSFSKEGYEVIYPLESEYPYFKIKSEKIKYICPNGHKKDISWNNWKSGRRCSLCFNKKQRLSFKFIKNSFEEKNYTVLTKKEDYKASYKQKIDYICPNGHAHQIYFRDFKNNHGCPFCYGNNKKEYNDIVKSFEKENYKVISKKIGNNKQKIDYICPNGHTHQIRWNDWQRGVRCGICDIKYSKEEKELKDFLISLNIDTSENDRKLIYPKEIDILCEKEKICIEYCGLYWHSDSVGNKDKKYHLNKTIECDEKGYRLITIFEDEWKNKNDIVKNRLKYIFNKSDDKKIYARKCNIFEISASQAKGFCEKYHLHGYGNSSIKLGAFYKDNLVSVMTFSRPSISKGRKDTQSNKWEVNRFCSSSIVTGILSKFISYLLKNYNIDDLYTFVDRRWDNGRSYEKIGFEKVKYTQPNYWYFLNNTLKRYHRFNFRKDRLPGILNNYNDGLTEYENMINNNYFRIWDCGNILYKYNI